jgi:hypothetical protein
MWGPMFKSTKPTPNGYIPENGQSVNEIYHRLYIIVCEYSTDIGKYRVIKNDCQGLNNLSYTIHLR